MRRRQFLALVCLAALTLSACAEADPEQMNRAAQAILTRSAEQGMVSPTRPTADPNAPQPTLGVVTATPSLIYALCIVREAAELHPQPNAAIAPVAELAAREIITAYGRTADVQWVLAWNKDRTSGWVTAGLVGCTVPTAELFPTAPDALAAQPAAVAAAPTDVPTPVPPTAAPTEVPTQAAAPTDVPTPVPPADAPTQAAAPTDVPAPVLPTETPAVADAPTETATTPPAEAPTQAAAPTPIIIIQIVTVVVTVTAAPAEPAVAATLAPPAPTPIPSPTFAPTTTPVTPEPTAAPATPIDSECVVTPGTPVNLRRGPSRTERLLGALPEGATFVAFGRNEDATWLYGATARRTFGWLIASAVACQSDVQALPVVDR